MNVSEAREAVEMDEKDSDILVHSVNFKKGGCFVGEMHSSLMSGYGTFEWSTGVKYTGYFVENKRHGYGVQEWPDGSRFEGEFVEDNRHGQGRHKWANGEVYEGEYQFDKRHGIGTYQWATGAKFTGNFQKDMKEGQGVYVAESGEKFEGTYKHDVRDGLGIQSYPGAGRRQDVGIWKGNKLVKLRFIIPEASMSSLLDTASSTASLELPDLKHRGKYGPKGPLETGSQELIQSAASNNCRKLRGLLRTGAVYVDVVDWLGHSALFAAAIHGHCDAANFLLDEGADVNLLDSAGLSALLACHHLLYSSCHPQLKNALQLDEREQISPSCASSSSNSSTTELILPSTAALFQSKTEDGVNLRMSPTPSNTSLPRGRVKSPITEALSLPLLHSAHTTIISPTHEQLPVRSFNTTMVKFTSLSSTLMNKGKLNNNSFEKNMLTGNGPDNIVPSDDQMNVQLTTSDIELEEQPMVLESVGSHDELVVLQTSTPAEVNKRKRSKDSFCSSEFGPIISAAQSTVLLYSATELTGSLLMDNCSCSSESTQIDLHGNGDTGKITAMIDLLLQRGASPDISACLLPAIMYPLLARDVDGVMRVAIKSESINKVGGVPPLHAACQLSGEQTPELVRCLLDHGADPNLPEFPSQQSSTGYPIAGLMQGLTSYTPLHIVCSRTDPAAAKLVPSLVQILLAREANPNVVAKGHSPLSLCIMNGYDEVVNQLIEAGADPNLALGRGVGTALCAITTTSAIKHHTLASSVAMVSYLLSHGANLLQPVVTREDCPPGTILDFIYEVADEDRMLSSTPYNLLNKQQRRLYRVSKKLRAYLVELLKVTVKHTTGEQVFLANVMKEEQHLVQMVEHYKVQTTDTNRRRARSAIPLGSHEQFHHRIHPGKSASLDIGTKSLTERTFMVDLKPVTNSTDNKLLPKLASHTNTVAAFPGSLQPPPKVAFLDTAEESEGCQVIPPPCSHLYSFCHYCGRSSGVQLTWCFQCHKAVYCSKSCRQNHWEEGHSTECIDPNTSTVRKRSLSMKTTTRVSSSTRGTRTRSITAPAKSQLPDISHTRTQPKH